MNAFTKKRDPESGLTPEPRERHMRLLRRPLRIERQPATRLRNRGRFNGKTLRPLEHEPNLGEANPSAGV